MTLVELKRLGGAVLGELAKRSLRTSDPQATRLIPCSAHGGTSAA